MSAEAPVLDDQIDRGFRRREDGGDLVELGALLPRVADLRELRLRTPDRLLRLADQSADLYLPGLEDRVGLLACER